MQVNFDTYTFEIQNTTNGPTLMCITSGEKLKGVKLPSKVTWYKAEAAEHTFFPREMYDDINVNNSQDAYCVFKNIISDILDGIGGYEFLEGMMRYLENDKVTYFIGKAISEIAVEKK